mmetsp:Transcript_9629/g.25840  ORF Transcript_9629/g.25840 Transcript_9629/m.25840 type:complete len:247 (+) Transcript_9629:808-1548(+)
MGARAEWRGCLRHKPLGTRARTWTAREPRLDVDVAQCRTVHRQRTQLVPPAEVLPWQRGDAQRLLPFLQLRRELPRHPAHRVVRAARRTFVDVLGCHALLVLEHSKDCGERGLRRRAFTQERGRRTRRGKFCRRRTRRRTRACQGNQVRHADRDVRKLKLGRGDLRQRVHGALHGTRSGGILAHKPDVQRRRLSPEADQAGDWIADSERSNVSDNSRGEKAHPIQGGCLVERRAGVGGTLDCAAVA